MSGDEPKLRVTVVGGGLAGLSTAQALLQARPGLALRVFEAEPSPGGKVRSTVQDGFTFDWGPNGFVRSSPATVALVEALGLADRWLPAQPAARRRYVYLNGVLQPVPSGSRALLGSRLLSPGAKLRALVGAARRWPVEGGEESVHGFLERRLGAAAAARLGEVMVSGLCAGDPRELSLDALFPQLRTMETRHGSLLRGMRAAGAAARQRPPGLDGRLSSFGGGMQTLIDGLVRLVGARLSSGRRVVAMRPAAPGGAHRLTLDDGEVVESEGVVLATEAFTAAELLAESAPEASRALAVIPYAGVQVVALGFAAAEVPRPMDGFGFLVPRAQGVRSLGVLWSSAVFPDQAPDGQVTLRAIAGGRLDPGFVELSEEQAIEAVLDDLRLTMGVTARPRSVMVKRWPRGIPQLVLGHQQRISHARDELAAAWPGLALVGNYLSGVAVNDVVREAAALAKDLSWLEQAHRRV